MDRIVISLVITLAFMIKGQASANTSILGNAADYSSQSVVMKGYLAYDENIKGRRPGVLVVHEWWGHNEYARKRARMLAEFGYTALAVDMYGDGRQAMHPDEAGKFSSELMKDFDTAKARFLAALDFLKEQPPLTPTALPPLATASEESCSIWRARAWTSKALPAFMEA